MRNMWSEKIFPNPHALSLAGLGTQAVGAAS
jgi:hypothetical protein